MECGLLVRFYKDETTNHSDHHKNALVQEQESTVYKFLFEKIEEGHLLVDTKEKNAEWYNQDHDDRLNTEPGQLFFVI